MPNSCFNRLHVIGATKNVEEFLRQAATPQRAYAPAHSLRLRLVEEIERGVDPIEADRILANWLGSIGGAPPALSPKQAKTGLLPMGFTRSDLPEWKRKAWLADWMEGVKARASRTTVSRVPEKQGWLSLQALLPVPEDVLGAGYTDAGRYWQEENWGTWSDIFDVSPPTMETRANGQRCAVYSFKTFRNPPLEALWAGSRRFPDLLFVVSFAEPHKDLYGAATFNNGEKSERDDGTAEDVFQDYIEIDHSEPIFDWIDDYLIVRAGTLEVERNHQCPVRNHDIPIEAIK